MQFLLAFLIMTFFVMLMIYTVMDSHARTTDYYRKYHKNDRER